MDNLPDEITRHICIFTAINTLEQFILSNNYLGTILNIQFWQEYFFLNQVEIITEQKSLSSWISEFKSNEILKLAKVHKSITCGNNIMAHIYNHPPIKCSTPSIPDSNFCYKCAEKLNINSKIRNCVIVDCTISIDISHASPYLSTVKTDHQDVLSHHSYIINSYRDGYLITNKQHQTFRHVPIEKNHLYNILFALFSNKQIINYQQL